MINKKYQNNEEKPIEKVKSKNFIIIIIIVSAIILISIFLIFML